uniref:Uncharacterized protein n=1 Tax=Rhizophora mucronata TaxID=61149 RepID=A0A2P2N3Y9_RHIMU
MSYQLEVIGTFCHNKINLAYSLPRLV